MASFAFVNFSAHIKAMTKVMKEMEEILAKTNKALTTPLEDVLRDILYEVAKGNGVVTDLTTTVSPTDGTVVEVRILLAGAGMRNMQSQTARPMRITPAPARSLMDFKTGPVPLPHRQSDQVYIGYRDFGWKPELNRLFSRNGYGWTPYAPMIALCQKRRHHDAPHEDCECGIYAFSRPDHPDLNTDAQVWGEVALWGDVLVCADGYRAEFAYPQTLFMHDDGLKRTRYIHDMIEQEYGVPVHLVKDRAGQTASEIIQAELDKLVNDFTSGRSTKNPLDIDWSKFSNPDIDF